MLKMWLFWGKKVRKYLKIKKAKNFKSQIKLYFSGSNKGWLHYYICFSEKTSQIVDSRPCPMDDSNFKLIDNQCFYFSKYGPNLTAAEENCKEKMRPYGGGQLFEPKSLSKNNRVAEIANALWGPSHPFPYIGVTDKLQEGTFAYISDGSTINFTPPWANGFNGSGGTSYNCILLATFSSSSRDIGQWADFGCHHNKWSICESTLVGN